VKSRFLEQPISYRLWQAPFAAAKFAPVQRHNDLGAVRRVLDVGCGPGTNAHLFAGMDYTGIDINERYIEYASERHPGKFIAADATQFEVPPEERFDFVLINSFLHHIADEDVSRILDHLRGVISEDGHIHVLELELPERRSVARLLARLDRGDHPRPLPEWRSLLSAAFEPVTFEPYRLGGARWATTTLWNMVYFKGRPLPRT
jgi:ubiquinone/menaquinone biosynthesis C-methylase UbiE